MTYIYVLTYITSRVILSPKEILPTQTHKNILLTFIFEETFT